MSGLGQVSDTPPRLLSMEVRTFRRWELHPALPPCVGTVGRLRPAHRGPSAWPRLPQCPREAAAPSPITVSGIMLPGRAQSGLSTCAWGLACTLGGWELPILLGTAGLQASEAHEGCLLANDQRLVAVFEQVLHGRDLRREGQAGPVTGQPAAGCLRGLDRRPPAPRQWPWWPPWPPDWTFHGGGGGPP